MTRPRHYNLRGQGQDINPHDQGQGTKVQDQGSKNLPRGEALPRDITSCIYFADDVDSVSYDCHNRPST